MKRVLRTGCISRKTVLEGIAGAVVLGPICWAIGLCPSILWCCGSMFLAPFVVDAIRPTWRVEA